ncbi:MAG: hypothetical protein IJL39_05215 [Clostridia bacterium]|nr:hypothetical protein [Clostridia bacterium]
MDRLLFAIGFASLMSVGFALLGAIAEIDSPALDTIFAVLERFMGGSE